MLCFFIQLVSKLTQTAYGFWGFWRGWRLCLGWTFFLWVLSSRFSKWHNLGFSGQCGSKGGNQGRQLIKTKKRNHERSHRGSCPPKRKVDYTNLKKVHNWNKPEETSFFLNGFNCAFFAASPKWSWTSRI